MEVVFLSVKSRCALLGRSIALSSIRLFRGPNPSILFFCHQLGGCPYFHPWSSLAHQLSIHIPTFRKKRVSSFHSYTISQNWLHDIYAGKDGNHVFLSWVMEVGFPSLQQPSDSSCLSLVAWEKRERNQSQSSCPRTCHYSSKLTFSKNKKNLAFSRPISYDITNIWNLKKIIWMSLFTKQKQTHRHRKQTYGYQMGRGGNGSIRSWD